MKDKSKLIEKNSDITIKVEDVETKIENSFWFKNVTKIIAILTAVCTILSFLVRGFYYVYQWGGFNAFGVDRIYIDVEGMGILYNALAYLGIAILWVVSNYFTYLFWVNKKKIYVLLFWFVEVILFWAIVICTSGNNLVNVILDILKQENALGYLELTWKMMKIVIALNVYGVYVGFSWKKEGRTEPNAIKYTFQEIVKKIVVFVIIVVVEGVATFCMGASDAKAREDYKLILENVEKNDTIEDRYLFPGEENLVRIYPVLHEDDDIYIISYLCNEESNIYIETGHQKVIAKTNVETVYCENVYDILKNISGNQQEETVINNKNKEERNNMTDTLTGAIIGAIVGALFTGICTLIIEGILRKMNRRAQESHAASMLYYDLKSVEDYLMNEHSSVNIRYTKEWQEMVANCGFLDNEKIAYLYKVYDGIYNYNYHYKLKESDGYGVVKENILQYGILKGLLGLEENTYSSEYVSVLSELEKYIK